MAELVDAADSKSVVRKDVPVRVRLGAPVFALRASPGAAKAKLAERRLPGVARRKPHEDGLVQDVHYVYIIRSTADPRQTYTGATEHLKQRLADHNAGKAPHTSNFVPWELECYIAFPEKQQAYDFETYLKSHSGRAFASKRLHRKRSRKDEG